MSRVGLTAKELEQLRYWRKRVDVDGVLGAPPSSIEAVLRQMLNVIDMLLREVAAPRGDA